MNNAPYDSIVMLEQKLTHYFQEPYHFLVRNFNTKYKYSNLVYTGNFLSELFKTQLFLENREYGLFCLCSRVRAIMSTFFDIPKESISVIDRYKLFPMLESEQSFPEHGQSWTMVYAGRICPAKNIDALIRVNSILQMKYNEDVQLYLYGNFDLDESVYPYTRQTSYKSYIEHLISSLPFKKKPILGGKVATEAWMNQSFINPVYCSFSSSHHEDFGVSAAQANQLGWPMILTNVGAHVDIVNLSTNAMLISLAHMSNHQYLDYFLDLNAQRIARVIWQRKFQRNENQASDFSLITDVKTKKIMGKKLISLIENKRSLYPADIKSFFAFPARFNHDFCDFNQFFLKYFRYWSDQAIPDVFIIINKDVNYTKINNLLLSDEKYQVLFFNQINSFWLKMLMSAKKILMSQGLKALRSLIEKNNTELIIYEIS
jgi:glycosyltransferase involved in cell wall biosynthesis